MSTLQFVCKLLDLVNPLELLLTSTESSEL
uniref:Uncharacterized protein n=1 Tax=Moniliophthora roreri TaxID=221103 RepID=A0A0W0FGF8_MONRR